MVVVKRRNVDALGDSLLRDFKVCIGNLQNLNLLALHHWHGCATCCFCLSDVVCLFCSFPPSTALVPKDPSELGIVNSENQLSK